MEKELLKLEKEGNESFLIYELTSEDSLDKLSFGMMSNNDIDGLLDMVYSQIDDSKKIKYRTSSKVSLKEALQERVNKKKIIGILRGFSNALHSADEYMIKSDKLLFDEEYIFVNQDTGVAEFICLPLEGVENEVDINAFLKSILFSLQYDDNENNDYISRFVNFVNSNEEFDIEEFDKILDSVDKGKAYTPPRKAKKQSMEDMQIPGTSSNSTAYENMEIPGAKETGILYTDNDIPEPKKSKRRQASSQKVDAGFAVPGGNDYNEDDYDEMDEQDLGEKISLMYLLQHYNKENAAIYKAQKEQRKKKSGKKSKSKSKKENVKIKGSQRKINVPGMDDAPETEEKEYVEESKSTQMGRVPGKDKPAESSPKGQSKVLFEPGKLQQEKGDFGETVILDREEFDDEATVLLEENKAVEKKVAYLIRTINGEKAELNKPIVRMGKESKFVDYQIKDNPAVSRLHAELITKDEGYFIKDSNSTNNTFVNGKEIESGEEVQIFDGDEIIMADETFEFHEE